MQRPSPEQLIKACLLQSGVQTSGTSTAGLSDDSGAAPAELWQRRRICAVAFTEPLPLQDQLPHSDGPQGSDTVTVH